MRSMIFPALRAFGLGIEVNALAALPGARQPAQRPEIGERIRIDVFRFGENVFRKGIHGETRTDVESYRRPNSLLDIRQLELDIGRAAVIALAGMGRGFHLAQQGVHLLGIQPPSGAHAHVAGQGAGHLLQPFLQRQRIAGLGDLVGQVAHQPLHVQLAQHGGDFAHHHRIGAEFLDHQPQLGQFGGAARHARHFRRVEVHHFGDQQRLARRCRHWPAPSSSAHRPAAHGRHAGRR